MSLVVVATLAAVAAGVGWFAARRGKRPDEDGPSPGAPAEATPAEDPAFAGLPLSLGDVVSVESQERWLAGALVGREGARVVSVLFFAPEGAAQDAVAVFAPPRREIWWLRQAEVACPDEPPAALEIAGKTFSRKSRLPLTIDRKGQGAPTPAEAGLWGCYESGPRDVALVLCSGGKTFAWSGTRHDEGEYDRMGKGG